jgi:multisubunit Na+/H+ antiporter MnhF subunit
LLAASAADKMNSAGSQLLTLLQVVAYWVVIIKCVIDVIKSANAGDRKSVLNILMTNVMLFATVYICPWIFDLIKDIFSK